jgi:hypothetical protein
MLSILIAVIGATVIGVIGNAELPAAISDRPHWQAAGYAAVDAPPGRTMSVRVQRVARPVRRERYLVTVVRDGRATSSTPFTVATTPSESGYGAAPW